MSRTVLLIQSSVAYGHVGNAAAAFIFQRLGFDVVRLDTVVFSNHPGRGRYRGAPTEPAALRALVRGLDEQGLLRRIGTLLSGYLGTAGNGAVVLEALADIRRDNPGALYCCDPVLGDKPKGIYVAADIPAFVRDRLIPSASIVTPNQFELELLTGKPAGDRSAAIGAAREILKLGPTLALVTGLPCGRWIETIALDRDRAWVARTPCLALPTSGAGDALTALFIGRLLEKPDVARALSLSVSALYSVLERTVETGADELRLVDRQDALVAPARLFFAERAD